MRPSLFDFLKLRARLFGATFVLLSLFATEGALALNVCLYARATNKPTSGHSFVTIENSQHQVIESYGFWPPDINPESLYINFPYDTPARIIEQVWGIEARRQTMPESRICQDVQNHTLSQIRAFVKNYPARYGRYKYLTNNCTHFAVRVYNAVTGDKIPAAATPWEVKSSIKRVYNAKVRSYSEYRRLK